MEEKKKEASKPKRNDLEKQKDMLEKDDGGKKSASAYEKIRLKNIQERLAMFKNLNFGELKNKVAPAKKTNEKKDYGRREKSSRIKDKETLKDNNAVDGKSAYSKTFSPLRRVLY